MSIRRLVWTALALFAVVLVAAPLPMLSPARGESALVLSPASSTVHWTGGPVFTGQPDTCPRLCHDVTVTTRVPAGYWDRHPGGVTFRIDWAQPSNVLELAIYDDRGRVLGFSGYGNVTYQQIYLAAPPNGTYTVEVVNYAAADATFVGTARIVSQATPLADQRGSDMAFAQSLVDPQILTADPGISVDNGGHVYVSSRLGEGNPSGSFLWRSNDEGATFRRVGDVVARPVHDPRHRPCVSAADAAADVDVVADRTGRLYLADLGTAGITAGYSTDHGNSWYCAPVPAASGSDDRPWLAAAPAADGGGPAVDAYLMYQTGAFVGELPGTSTATPEQLRVDVTRDGGRTWTAGGSFATGKASIPGEFFAGPDGTVYEVYSADNAVWLAASRDHGRTFVEHRVSQRLGDPRGDGWTAGGRDANGTLYAAWVDQGSWAVLYARSFNGGVSWTSPRQLNPPGTTAMKVWLATGRTGDLAVAWYAADGTFPLYAAPAAAQWHVWTARSLDATAATPHFAVTRATDLPVGFGPERDPTTSSISASLSNFGDALRVAILPTGGLVISYADLGFTTDFAALVVVARQVSGLGMAAPSPVGRWRPWQPPTPHFTAVEEPFAASGCPQMRFAGLPSTRVIGSDAVLTFSLANADDIRRAPRQCAPYYSRPDGRWVATWRTAGHRQYAGVAVDSSSAPPAFFGGLDPDQVAYPGLTATAAAYPATLRLAGVVSARARSISIRVPLGAYLLASGDTLHDVQLFSLVGNATAETPQTLFRLVDMTPPVDLRLP